MTLPKDRWLQAACLAATCITTPCSAAGEWVEDARGCKVAAQPGATSESVAWSGACRDGLAEGRGQLRRFINGVHASTYDGDMKAGRASGQGVLTTAAGVRYEGGFVGGQLEGQCAIVWQSGLRYDGECRAGSPDGRGQMRYANGDHFRGDVSGGVLQGQGRYVWARGDAYKGDFRGGVMAGNGDYRFADGSRYVGGFSGNRPSGQGRVVLPNGLGYEGPFEHGVPTGDSRFFKPGEAALADSPQHRDRLSLAYAEPQVAFVQVTQVQRPVVHRYVSSHSVCRSMGQPQVAPLNWSGEALYEAVAEVKDGSVVSVALKALKPAGNPTAQARLEEAIERALRQTYECPGNHVFVQQFQFRYE